MVARIDPLRRVERAVAVLIDGATARVERHRRAVGPVNGQRACRPEAVADDVDRDRRDALCASVDATANGLLFLLSPNP